MMLFILERTVITTVSSNVCMKMVLKLLPTLLRDGNYITEIMVNVPSVSISV